MKGYFLMLIGTIFISSMAQTSDKELIKHAEKVAKSKEKSKNLVSLDTLFASGKPYCLMKGSKKFLGSYGIYSIRPLGNPENEEIYMEMEAEGTGAEAVWYWNMVFVNQGQKIRFKNGSLDIENTIVDYNLLNENGLNLTGMNKLVLLKGGKAQAQTVPVKTNTTVSRDRTGTIQIFGNSIQQSGVQIGSMVKLVKAENGGVITYFTVSLPNGEIVATASNNGATDHEWKIVTAKDNSIQFVSSTIGKDEIEIAKYLVEHLYL